jgi:hypothetical protein
VSSGHFENRRRGVHRTQISPLRSGAHDIDPEGTKSALILRSTITSGRSGLSGPQWTEWKQGSVKECKAVSGCDFREPFSSFVPSVPLADVAPALFITFFVCRATCPPKSGVGRTTEEVCFVVKFVFAFNSVSGTSLCRPYRATRCAGHRSHLYRDGGVLFLGYRQVRGDEPLDGRRSFWSPSPR